MNPSCSTSAESAVAAGPRETVLEIMRRRPGMHGLTAGEKTSALRSLGDISRRIERVRAAAINVELNPELERFITANGNA